ncbi:MAG: methyltransferase domain-containing protein [Candidatus Paceibacterota bacterium]
MNIFNVYSSRYDKFVNTFGYDEKDGIIIKELDPSPDQVILDIGGGTGRLARKISQYVKKFVVLDSSEKMLKEVPEDNKIETCLAMAQNIPFKDSSFDSILCIDALHHIKAIDETIREINRVIKKDGKIVICEFDIRGINGFMFWMFEKIIDNSKFIKPRELLVKMENNGFNGKIIKLPGLEYLYIGQKNGI